MEYVWMAILVVATMVVIAMPIVRADASGEEPEAVDLTLARLEEEKESAYNALKEAEFDYKTGKLSDEDYKSIKDKYSNKAMEALHELEEYGKQSEVRSAKSEVQSEIMDGKATSGQKTGQKFCGSCGAQLPQAAKFCGECGNKVG